LGIYAIGDFFSPDGGKIFNEAVVFGRRGEKRGSYRKTHVPPDELWHVAPGDELNVIELDFGVIGISICYDMMFPETVSVLSLKGAEAIFHPTGGYGWYDAIGDATLRTRANDCGVYIITAKNWVPSHAGNSGVIDHWGQTLVNAGFRPDAAVCAAIDLDESKSQPDWFVPVQMSGQPDVALRKLGERRPELYSLLSKKLHEAFSAPGEETRQRIMEKIKRGECRWG
jgi:predicted amidohydrolase